MSHNEEQLDLFLRKTLESKNFEQKPHYWEGAKTLIDNHRKQRNRNTLIYSLSVVLVAVVASAWMLVSKPSGSTEATKDLAFAPVNPQQTNPNTTEQAMPAPKSSSNLSDPSSETPSQTTAVGQDQTSTANEEIFTANNSNNKQTSTGKNSRTSVSNAESISNTGVTNIYTTKEPESIQSRKLAQLPGYSNTIPTDSFNRKEFAQAYAKRKQQQFLLVEAGLNSYNGLSVNFHGGLRYMRFINDRFAFSIGASYAQLNQDLNRNYRNIDYTFGQQVQETNIQTARIDYIELPVAAHYSFNTKHLINLGMIPAYAIHTKDVVTYSMGENTSTQSTYPDAVNRFDLQLHLGYSYRFNETWMVSAGYQFGLMDVSNNNVFKSTTFDRNQGLRLTLGYKLF